MIDQNALEFEYLARYRDHNKTEVLSLLMRNIEDFKPHLTTNVIGLTNEERIKKYLQTVEHIMLVHFNKELIGVSVLKVDTTISGYEEVTESLLIETSLIDSKYRGKGIGQLLYSEIEEVNRYILQKPIIFRGVWSNNESQVHLNHKLGYSLLQEYTYNLGSSESEVTRFLYSKVVSL